MVGSINLNKIFVDSIQRGVERRIFGFVFKKVQTIQL